MQKISRSSGLAEEAYKRIRAEIMSLRIKPNTRLTIDGLARELGISQTPIREALGMLEAIGLITKRPLGGYCTGPQFSRDQYEKLFEVRLLLEPHAANIAAKNINESDVAELALLIKKMEPDNANSSTYDMLADHDSEFHVKIASACGNNLIAEALDRLHTHHYIFGLGVPPGYTADNNFEHAKIYRALAERNARAAEHAMRMHIENSFKRLVPFMGLAPPPLNPY